MPLLSLSTNVVMDAAEEIEMAGCLSTLVAKHLSKPEQWVMTHITAQQSMTFAGSIAPCAYVECKSIGLGDAQILPLAKALCDFLQQRLQLDPARIYIEFSSAQAQHWGWNGGTF